jgi:hypothetical protein
VGVLFTIAVVVAVAIDVVPNVAIFLIPAYWVAGWLLSMFLFLVVLSPRLDRAYPSPMPPRTRRRADRYSVPIADRPSGSQKRSFPSDSTQPAGWVLA